MSKKYNQKFIYTELAKPSLGHTEPYNLFGVIIDATCAYSKQRDPKQKPMWICGVKMIDQSLNVKAAQILKDYDQKQTFTNNSSTFANLTFFGFQESFVPKIFKVGDILRVQHVNCAEYKGQRQFTASMFGNNSKSKWAIYQGCLDQETDTEQEETFLTKQSFQEEGEKKEKPSSKFIPVNYDPYEPIAHSGESYSLHEVEKEIIDNLRSWSKRYFQDFQTFESETQLPLRKQNNDGSFFYKDFDIQAKVIHMNKLGDQVCKIMF